MKLPHGACDCHMHIYDSGFPASPDAVLMPPDASVADYLPALRAWGMARCVVVTPSTYGFDNRCTLQALHRLQSSGVEARGIAVLQAGTQTAALQQLHAAGVRGVRFNQTRGGTSLDDLEALAKEIAPFGWHVELLLPAGLWPAIADRIRALPVPVVFDHFGRLPHPGVRHEGHRAMLSLLETGRAWVKLSGAYLQGGSVESWSTDADALAAAFLQVAPDRMVWGSNWPHPTSHAGLHQAPADAQQIDQLLRWTEATRTLQRVLVDNPAELYNF